MINSCPNCHTRFRSFKFKENDWMGHHYEMWGCPDCEVGVVHDTTEEGIEEAKDKWTLFISQLTEGKVESTWKLYDAPGVCSFCGSIQCSGRCFK